ncbi:MAG: flavodoxin family protein, partial [Deferribacteraceae bacterium]|nr:flavodoxin family protein [Deferribacteraceae bacterium]
MKVIAINGSPKKNGNTMAALGKMCEVLEKSGIETEIITVGNLALHGCIACGHCGSSEQNRCVFKDDIVNEVAQKMRDADGFILGSPTYYAAIGGTMKCFLDRVFYSSSSYFRHKVAAVAAITRRAGAVAVYNQLMNYLALADVVVAPTTYWSAVYGRTPGEVLQDAEGIQTLERSAAGMAWLLKMIKESKVPA